MALYETILIFRQDISSTQVETLTETFSNILKEQGGSVVKTEQWGLKTLTYRINKNRKGHYVYLGLDAPAAAVAEMERNLSINEDVLRVMTVKVEKIEEGQTAMLANKGERAERGPRGGFGDRGPRREFGDRGPREGGFSRGPRRDAAGEGEGDRA
ncbi:30S ribosomal protein S6 [Niveispirillum lacus]|uniref:Small ribosomal subunit protein bS6 n=1 Tax=Niveispirillum lacus TaxID=1981099 RepID=A0A255YVK9_9PROT|nr:30S ribosomal protein S6 [Niveispirillum lacus]OYQ32685.1 30S ribosomal protein S6 [Niveispirillum lacus]